MTEKIRKCPLCTREMPKGSFSGHHLIPKAYKGQEIILIHNICHDKIHHTFSEAELAHHYNTIERLLTHPEIIKFVKWVKKQNPYFYDKNKDTKDRRRKR